MPSHAARTEQLAATSISGLECGISLRRARRVSKFTVNRYFLWGAMPCLAAGHPELHDSVRGVMNSQLLGPSMAGGTPPSADAGSSLAESDH